jgi:hypothetical protein
MNFCEEKYRSECGMIQGFIGRNVRRECAMHALFGRKKEEVEGTHITLETILTHPAEQNINPLYCLSSTRGLVLELFL